MLFSEENKQKLEMLIRAFFNVLSKKTQDDIIGKTEQTL